MRLDFDGGWELHFWGEDFAPMLFGPRNVCVELDAEDGALLIDPGDSDGRTLRVPSAPLEALRAAAREYAKR